MKFTLDTTLSAMLNVTSAEAAGGHRFAEAVFAAGGVAAIFGVDDFITVTRPARLRVGSDRRGRRQCSRERAIATKSSQGLPGHRAITLDAFAGELHTKSRLSANTPAFEAV